MVARVGFNGADIVDYDIDSFAFVMVSYLSGHYGFLGGSGGGFYKYARIEEDSAFFNDTGAYADGKPLYYEGEEPCELIFRLVDNESINISEKNTCGVYGCSGIYWWGKYQKFHDTKILLDLKEWSSRGY